MIYVDRSFNSEDISVGLWLSPFQDTLRVHDRRFDTEWTSRGCQNIYFVTHNISQETMMVLYQNLISNGKLCAKEVKKRDYYLYNWNVPPSECCRSSN